jgi:hypothetical protein
MYMRKKEEGFRLCTVSNERRTNQKLENLSEL